MKNILLPTDFSENSLNAIQYAMHFFENWECNFFILNVQKFSDYISDDLAAGSSSDIIYDSIAKDNKSLISNLVTKLKEEYKSQSYTFHGLFDYDDFVAAIDQAVQFHAIDLIIMGTNGATGASEVLFGSNTLQVIRNITCPILTIPENYTYTNIKKALFSTQHGEDFSTIGLNAFKELLNIQQCELDVLELDENENTEPQKENNDYIQSLFPDYPYTYYHLNIHSIPGIIAVQTATQLLKVDIHAIFIEKKSFLERLFFGSEIPQLAYGTLVPLLFLHR